MKKNIFTIITSAVILIACNQKPDNESKSAETNTEKSTAKTNELGKVISIEEFGELATNEINNGIRFTIVGYPNITTPIETHYIGEDNDEMPSRIKFYEKQNGEGKEIGFFPIWQGKDKNQFEQPEPFDKAKVTFYDNNGVALTQAEPMKISFTMDLQVRVGKRKILGKEVFDGGPVDVRIDKGQ